MYLDYYICSVTHTHAHTQGTCFSKHQLLFNRVSFPRSVLAKLRSFNSSVEQDLNEQRTKLERWEECTSTEDAFHLHVHVSTGLRLETLHRGGKSWKLEIGGGRHNLHPLYIKYINHISPGGGGERLRLGELNAPPAPLWNPEFCTHIVVYL